MNRKTSESENTDFDDLEWCVHAIASFVTQYAKGQRKPLSNGQTVQKSSNSKMKNKDFWRLKKNKTNPAEY